MPQDRDQEKIDDEIRPTLGENSSPAWDDPELEQEFQAWAQLLLDIHLWKRQQKQDLGSEHGIDAPPQSPTL
jgi:hypothetical protein